MEEELMKNMRFQQADNKTNIPQAPSQPMPMRTNLFGGIADAKRMSFDDNMPQYGTSPTSILGQSPGGSWGITGAISGGAPNYNRDRRDSLKNMVHLQDFGTD